MHMSANIPLYIILSFKSTYYACTLILVSVAVHDCPKVGMVNQKRACSCARFAQTKFKYVSSDDSCICMIIRLCDWVHYSAFACSQYIHLSNALMHRKNTV